jgi:mannose-6-phosphate isomerase-like protein (cupin superfamily)
MSTHAQILEPGEGQAMTLAAGVTISLKSTSADTDGGWTLLEYTAPPNFAGPAPHWHKETDEAFFVLEGTIRFEVDGENVDLQAGGYARVPPGVVHRFSNPTDKPSRFLGVAIPGGLEQVPRGTGRADGQGAVVAAGRHGAGDGADGDLRHVPAARSQTVSLPAGPRYL